MRQRAATRISGHPQVSPAQIERCQADRHVVVRIFCIVYLPQQGIGAAAHHEIETAQVFPPQIHKRGGAQPQHQPTLEQEHSSNQSPPQ